MFCMVISIENCNISSLIKKEEGKDQIILQFILWNCFHVQITFFFYVMTSVKYLKNKKNQLFRKWNNCFCYCYFFPGTRVNGYKER